MTIYIDQEKFNHFIDSIQYYPGYSLLKDYNSIYLGCNDATAHLIGYKKGKDLMGRSDFELKCSAAQYANEFRLADQLHFENPESVYSLCFSKYQDGYKLLFGRREVVLNKNNEIKGLMTTGFDITEISILNFGVVFNQILLHKVQNQHPFVFQIVKQYPDLGLTKRQSQVLFYHLNGMSAKESAKTLKISPNTIERHLEDIKLRLACHTKSQLFEKAITMGLMNFMLIPEQI